MPGSSKRRDLYPQYQDIELVMTAADTAVLAEVTLPVPRIPASGKATIIEILEFDWTWVGISIGTTGGTTVAAMVSTNQRTIDASSNTTLMNSLSDGHTIDHYFIRHLFATHVGIQVIPHQPETHDMIFDGKGFLVAGDKIWISLDSLGAPSVNSMHVRMWYRFVEVNVQEYVGIIQSQTQ